MPFALLIVIYTSILGLVFLGVFLEEVLGINVVPPAEVREGVIE